MMASLNGSILRVTGPLCGEFTVTGEIPSQRPVTRSLNVFFDLNKRLSKQSGGWWFETPSCSLWRHYNANWYTKRLNVRESERCVKVLILFPLVAVYVYMLPLIWCTHWWSGMVFVFNLWLTHLLPNSERDISFSDNTTYLIKNFLKLGVVIHSDPLRGGGY